MPRLILGDGATRARCKLFFIGERPGREEHKAGLGFIGPAGQELWDRCEHLGLPTDRDVDTADIYVTNLVKTFSVKPPTPLEIERDKSLLYSELLRVRPTVIVTVGYHAARALLPQFEGVNGDFFHGLAFPYVYGRVHPSHAVVVPIVHAAAALRQPDRYQNQLTDDLRAVRRVLRAVERGEPIPFHTTHAPKPYRVGLAQFGRDDLTIGLDTEGYLQRSRSHPGVGIECVTIAVDRANACICELPPNQPPTKFLSPAIRNAAIVAIHHAKHDWQALHDIGISPRPATIRDTMMEAYLLDLPQSLKVLAYRILGFEMAEYEDLIQPIDDARVRATLTRFYDRSKAAKEQAAAIERQQRERRHAASRHGRGRDRSAAGRGRGAAAGERTPQGHGDVSRRDGGRDRRAPSEEAPEEARSVGQQETRNSGGGAAAAADSARGQGRTPGRAPVQRQEGSQRRHGDCPSGSTAPQAQPEAALVRLETPAEEGQRLQDLDPPLTLTTIPTRALTSINSILTKVVESGDSRRDRWSKSKFAPIIPLPTPPTWRDAPQGQRIEYALTDAVAHVEVHRTLAPRLTARDLDRVYALDRGVLPFLVRNEEIGMACDRKAIRALSKQFAIDFTHICERINRRAGKLVNPLSGDQVSDCLFDQLEISPTRLTKSGKHYTTADKYLKARKLEHKIIPDILEARQINKYKGTYCVAPKTKVLTSRLQWVPASELVKGDSILAFDEYPEHAKQWRKWRHSKVLAAPIIQKDCFEIEFEDGTTVTCTRDHHWLARSCAKGKLEWVRTDHLKQRKWLVAKPLDIWTRREDFDAGYIAAAYDGEGNLSRSTNATGMRLGFAQKKGKMLRRMRRLLHENGFTVCHSVRPNTDYLAIGRSRQVFRLLGEFRPVRLLEKFAQLSSLPNTNFATAFGVRALRHLGSRDVVALQTDAHTFVAEGFASHNTDKLPDMLVRHGKNHYRYHAEWKYTRTATGRLAETVILLIPKHTARGKQIRNCFYAREGNVLVSVDLSQIELRQMAHESQDRVLLDVFKRGIDAHARTAHELLGAPKAKADQDESLHRLPAKTLNFGIINGMTEYGMLDQLHEAGQLQWTIDDVRELLKEWFVLHRGVRVWWDGQIKFCRAKGYVKDMFGRRRYISAIWSTDDRIVAGAERQTLMPIQAGADGISKVWNARIWRHVIRPYQKQGRYCEPWVRVHDDTTLEVDRRIAKDVQRAMLRLVPDLLSVPTTAEGKSGTQWGDLH